MSFCDLYSKSMASRDFAPNTRCYARGKATGQTKRMVYVAGQGSTPLSIDSGNGYHLTAVPV